MVNTCIGQALRAPEIAVTTWEPLGMGGEMPRTEVNVLCSKQKKRKPRNKQPINFSLLIEYFKNYSAIPQQNYKDRKKRKKPQMVSHAIRKLRRVSIHYCCVLDHGGTRLISYRLRCFTPRSTRLVQPHSSTWPVTCYPVNSVQPSDPGSGLSRDLARAVYLVRTVKPVDLLGMGGWS
ncbi:hypothetical protein RRG08_042963 [Elysia crispata]|uniref:Uncharacterized protein n=1 Tax=Elysia crispata TaxID=231223 RepID=A0AAE1AXQ2_9GAST|nr:hypothetical protein RRG08_042963 [Elysia crispata]